MNQPHVGKASVLEFISGKEGEANRIFQSLGSALLSPPSQQACMVGIHRGHHSDPVNHGFSYLTTTQTRQPTCFRWHGSWINPAPLEVRRNRVDGVEPRYSFFFNSPLYEHCSDLSSVCEKFRGAESWKVSVWWDARPPPAVLRLLSPPPVCHFATPIAISCCCGRGPAGPHDCRVTRFVEAFQIL